MSFLFWYSANLIFSWTLKEVWENGWLCVVWGKSLGRLFIHQRVSSQTKALLIIPLRTLTHTPFPTHLTTPVATSPPSVQHFRTHITYLPSLAHHQGRERRNCNVFQCGESAASWVFLVFMEKIQCQQLF